MGDKISCLLVTRNQPGKLIELVKHIYDIVDDIVIVDSSDKKKFTILKSTLKRFKKVRIFYAAPLGYEEPYRMYGLKKTRYDWTLSLDLGVRLNPALKRDFRNIVNNNMGFFGFMIRQENLLNGKRVYSESYGIHVGKNDWQVKLFRRSKVKFYGIVHESPDLGGRWISPSGEEERIHILPSKYKFTQIRETGDFKYKIMKCMKLEMFERRYTYGSVNLPTVLKKIFLFYGAIKGIDKNSELSESDYKVHERLYAILNSNEHLLEAVRPMPYYFRRKIATIFAADPKLKELSFAVNEDIKKTGGVIKYLRLDNERAIGSLNKKYAGIKLKGIDLFVKLLVEEFYRRHPDWRTNISSDEVLSLLNEAIEKSAG